MLRSNAPRQKHCVFVIGYTIAMDAAPPSAHRIKRGVFLMIRQRHTWRPCAGVCWQFFVLSQNDGIVELLSTLHNKLSCNTHNDIRMCSLAACARCRVPAQLYMLLV